MGRVSLAPVVIRHGSLLLLAQLCVGLKCKRFIYPGCHSPLCQPAVGLPMLQVRSGCWPRIGCWDGLMCQWTVSLAPCIPSPELHAHPQTLHFGYLLPVAWSSDLGWYMIGMSLELKELSNCRAPKGYVLCDKRHKTASAHQNPPDFYMQSMTQ